MIILAKHKYSFIFVYSFEFYTVCVWGLFVCLSFLLRIMLRWLSGTPRRRFPIFFLFGGEYLRFVMMLSLRRLRIMMRRFYVRSALQSRNLQEESICLHVVRKPGRDRVCTYKRKLKKNARREFLYIYGQTRALFVCLCINLICLQCGLMTISRIEKTASFWRVDTCCEDDGVLLVLKVVIVTMMMGNIFGWEFCKFLCVKEPASEAYIVTNDGMAIAFQRTNNLEHVTLAAVEGISYSGPFSVYQTASWYYVKSVDWNTRVTTVICAENVNVPLSIREKNELGVALDGGG